MANIRWRLVMGLVSFMATVIVTFPAGAGAAAQRLNNAVADIWPNGNVADIWPNDVLTDVLLNADIWPNGILPVVEPDNTSPSD